MIRLFVGLDLPDPVRMVLGGIGSGVPGARWTPPGNLHVTLRFIGEVDETTADAIDVALSGIRAPDFEMTLAGCGAFASGHRAHTLWTGVERGPALLHLQDKVESAVVRAGVAPEGRKYQPHVTLARLKATPTSRLQSFIAGHNLLRATIAVEHFVLFSSRLGHEAPVYTAEAEYPLAG